MYGLSLIFILAVIGGVIAYIGDKIGMKIGRKRLTLFGLRPKYTGVVITIFTGIFISLASIVILTVASDDVRTALFEMKEIQATLTANQQQLELSMAAMAQMESELDRLVLERDSAAADLEKAQTQLEQGRIQYEELELKRDELAANVDDLEKRILQLADDFMLLYMSAERIRTGNVAFRADEIIYAQVVESSPDIKQIYDQLESVLEQADQKAYALGARVEDDPPRAIVLDQEQVHFAAYFIMQEQGLYVVRVLSTRNTAVGEPVAVDLQIIRNDLLFEKGAVLEENTVDLSRASDIDLQILNLLEKANAVAVIRGMITSETGGAVKVDGNEFYSAMDRVKELAESEGRQGSVKIQAKALEDTFAVAGPVKLKLEIVPE